ncbi:LlaJI family restriction endonuclease [Psychrobacter sp. H8-1]|uniref:LlaJI family restriction endonuclease n=1 Tax=Psychrobacter sp. H8-1 TaxID=2774129 RepID=UPI00191A5071|nr:LlaJI family restriction endonuclease [Psychrobacter sp. H8-1]
MSNDKDTTLASLCSNATNQDGDDFVGLSYIWDEIQKKYIVKVKFPLGYRISEDDISIRQEILQLMSVLRDYGDMHSSLPNFTQDSSTKYNSFPINAYRVLIYDYLNRGGYYQEYEEIYVSRSSGKVNWNRTIRKERPMVQKSGVAYLTMQVRKNNFTDKNLITEISQYCVYESFLKLGWLYNLKLPPKPSLVFNKTRYIIALNTKLLSVNQDSDKKLFQSMLDIISSSDRPTKQNEPLHFGTHNFEYIWENIIEEVFGNMDKKRYFPKARWELYFGNDTDSSKLKPDTIMRKDNIFVLDAKYYQYGETADEKRHLPYSSDINKQITYGEHIANHECNTDLKVFNAFLMPFRKNHPIFSTDKDYLLIGTTKANWKADAYSYESVKGILVDTKHLMSIKSSLHDYEKDKLSQVIEQGSYERIAGK